MSTASTQTKQPDPADPGRGADPGGAARPRMTPYEKWSLATNVVGFLLVTLSLCAAWSQLKQVSAQNRMTVHAQRETSTLTLDRLFVEYPELRQYFYNGVEITEKDPSYKRVEALAEMHLDIFDYKLKHSEVFAEYQPFRELEEAWIRDMFRASPILRSYCAKRKAWYSPMLHRLADASRRTK